MMVIKFVTVSLIRGCDLPLLIDNGSAKRPIYIFITDSGARATLLWRRFHSFLHNLPTVRYRWFLLSKISVFFQIFSFHDSITLKWLCIVLSPLLTSFSSNTPSINCEPSFSRSEKSPTYCDVSEGCSAPAGMATLSSVPVTRVLTGWIIFWR